MALMSFLLSGNPRIEQAAAGPPSIKKRPPDDDPNAIKSIQLALVELGYPLPLSFQSGSPDGIFGAETERAVIAYQKKSFAGQAGEWDGRLGPKTLARMDSELPGREPNQRVAATFVHVISHCLETEPEDETTTGPVATLPNRTATPTGPSLPGRA
jgi:peptidoglycan hydrolase-like protein with peptidoglycan-binding domain